MHDYLFGGYLLANAITFAGEVILCGVGLVTAIACAEGLYGHLRKKREETCQRQSERDISDLMK